MVLTQSVSNLVVKYIHSQIYLSLSMTVKMEIVKTWQIFPTEEHFTLIRTWKISHSLGNTLNGHRNLT